jgi:hypothetical protein
VLDVYIRLFQNDGFQEAPPLSLRLSVQLKFASSFSILREAASDGRGMSSFSFLNNPDHESVAYYHEVADHEDEAVDNDDNGSDQPQQDNSDEQDGHYDNGEAEEQVDGTDEVLEQSGTPNHDDDAEGEPLEGETESFYDEIAGESTSAGVPEPTKEEQDELEELNSTLDTSTQVNHEDNTTILLVEEPGFSGVKSDAFDGTSPTGVEPHTILRTVDAESTIDFQQEQSTTSSATFQGDPKEDSASESNTDEIADWIEGLLTPDTSVLGGEDHADFTDFEGEPGDQEAAEGLTAHSTDITDNQSASALEPLKDSLEEEPQSETLDPKLASAETHHAQRTNSLVDETASGETSKPNEPSSTTQFEEGAELYDEEPGLFDDDWDDIGETSASVDDKQASTIDSLEYPEDDLDDDFGFDEVANKDSSIPGTRSDMRASTSKRSLDETDNIDVAGEGQPEIKKARGS